MTVVEFLSDDPVENAASLLSLRPERVVFLGDEAAVRRHRAALTRLNMSLENQSILSFLAVDPHDFTAIGARVGELCDRFEDVCFDLTGGDEIAVAAIGRLFEQRSSVCMQRFDLKRGVLIRVSDNQPLPLAAPLCMSIEQFVPLFGGEAGSSADGDALRSWSYSRESMQTLIGLWGVCSKDPNRWNKTIGALCSLLKCATYDHTALRVSIDRTQAKQRVLRFEEKMDLTTRLLHELEREGLVQFDGKGVFSYATPLVKHCMAKEGNLLEMYTLFTAKSLRNAKGDFVFCDAKCGVYMDWDGAFGEPNNTHNEIDVMLMCGVTPVFISCKNGEVDDKELYKLSAVANRFGGERAKKALVATFVDKNQPAYAVFKERASQMGITLIDRVERLSAGAFSERLRALAEE